MAIDFNIRADLDATEAAIVDWKRRAKEYENCKLAVPKHIDDRIDMLKKDALLLRDQLNREANR
jgi:hypothetical protein